MAFSWADELVSFFSLEHLFSLILASFRVIGSVVLYRSIWSGFSLVDLVCHVSCACISIRVCGTSRQIADMIVFSSNSASECPPSPAGIERPSTEFAFESVMNIWISISQVFCFQIQLRHSLTSR